jgi:hypothetical protein
VLFLLLTLILFFGVAKQTKNQPNQIDFRFVSAQTAHFFVCFVDTLVFMLFFRFFWLVSKQIYLFRLFCLFRNGIKIPKQTETKFFLVARNKPKIYPNRFSFGLFQFERLPTLVE